MSERPLWHQRLSRSLHGSRSKPESRYFQLATVDTHGAPQARTVVFRGFDSSGEVVQMITDTRSQKYAELNANEHASICWYFTQSREQYRFEGDVSISLSDTDIAIQAWRDLSSNGKAQFLWGEPCSELTDTEEFNLALANNADVPEHFCVLHFRVLKLDYLNLKLHTAGRSQTREIYRKDGDTWACQAVIP